MDIRLDNPEKIADAMSDCIYRYSKAARKRRGMMPYISAYCMDFNFIKIDLRNSVEDLYSSSSDRRILVTVHYSPGEPNFKCAENWSETDFMDALWLAELGAYENYGIQKHSASLYPPFRMLHDENVGIKRCINPEFEDFSKISVDEVLNWLAKLDSKMKSVHSSVIDTKASIDLTVGNDIFCDNLETQIIQKHSRMTAGMIASAIADDLPYRRFTTYERIGAFGGYELLKKYNGSALKSAKEVAEKAVIFAKAKNSYKDFRLTAGEYDAVLDGKVSGVAIHEVGAGHMAEANNSIILREQEGEEHSATPFEGRVGDKIAVDDLNILDYGLLEINGEKPFSWYAYDAEGTRTKKTWIIKNGRFNSYLHSKLTAGTLSKKYGGGFLTGNARIEKPSDEEGHATRPEPRMSTLFISPSRKKCSLEDMLHLIAGKGLYFSGLSSGEVGETSQGKIEFQEIYYVDKKCNLIPLRLAEHELFIIDDAVGFMGKISAVGDKSTVRIDAGWCGADSGAIPHSASGAALKVDKIHLVSQLTDKPYKKPFLKYPRR